MTVLSIISFFVSTLRARAEFLRLQVILLLLLASYHFEAWRSRLELRTDNMPTYGNRHSRSFFSARLRSLRYDLPTVQHVPGRAREKPKPTFQDRAVQQVTKEMQWEANAYAPFRACYMTA